MDGAFACPECGYELKVKGLAPGRQVQCGWCEAWVEIPFFPRNLGGSRPRSTSKRRGLWVFWAWGGVALLSVVVVVVGMTRVVQSRARAAQEKALAELSASVQDYERQGRFDQALAELEAALVLAREAVPSSGERVSELLAHRDQLARREVKARLSALEQVQPYQAVGDCLSLLARLQKLPDLADLEDEVRARLEEAAGRSVTLDFAAARRAFESGKPGEAFRLCERVDKTADHLPTVPRREARASAKALVTQIVEKHGVVFEPVGGTFALGSGQSYATALRPLLSDGLTPHGYLPSPIGSEWCPVWEQRAPYRIVIDVSERLATNYLSSRNRTTWIDAKIVLQLRGAALWERTFNGRTRVPVPNLPALQASRLAVGNHSSLEFERLLYDDARAVLFEQLVKLLRSAPDCGASSLGPPRESQSAPSVPFAQHVSAPLR